MKNYHIDIYKINDDNSLRFVLGTKGLKPLIVIGLNPIRADDFKPDMTISKIIGFANKNQYDSFVMLNLYPQRTTFPNNLDLKIDLLTQDANIKSIIGTLTGLSEINILAAWGEPIKKRNYLKQCLYDINSSISDLNVNWWHIGELTASGHPRHPSRASYSLGLHFLDINKYLNSL